MFYCIFYQVNAVNANIIIIMYIIIKKKFHEIMDLTCFKTRQRERMCVCECVCVCVEGVSLWWLRGCWWWKKSLAAFVVDNERLMQVWKTEYGHHLLYTRLCSENESTAKHTY